MARIRTIKPEFWEDEVVGCLPRDARLLFIASLNLADDEGLLRWSAAYLKSGAFIYDDDIGIGEVERLMRTLTDAGIVYAYRAGKAQQPFAYIVNFHKHQKINRPSPSKLPPPPLQAQETSEMYARRDGWRCHLCNGSINECVDHETGDDFCLSLDHVLPESKGGGDHPSNIRASHQTCNKGRCNRTIAEYRAVLASGKTSAQVRYGDRHPAMSYSLSNSVSDSPMEGNGSGSGSGSGGDGIPDDSDERVLEIIQAYPFSKYRHEMEIPPVVTNAVFHAYHLEGNSFEKVLEFTRSYARSVDNPKFVMAPEKFYNDPNLYRRDWNAAGTKTGRFTEILNSMAEVGGESGEQSGANGSRKGSSV